MAYICKRVLPCFGRRPDFHIAEPTRSSSRSQIFHSFVDGSPGCPYREAALLEDSVHALQRHLSLLGQIALPPNCDRALDLLAEAVHILQDGLERTDCPQLSSGGLPAPLTGRGRTPVLTDEAALLMARPAHLSLEAASNLDARHTLHSLLAAASVQQALAKQPGLEPGCAAPWLNEFVSTLWPRINEHVEKVIKEKIEPSINESLPGMLKGSVTFTRATLGKSSPCLGPVHVHHHAEQDGTCGPIEIHLGIDFRSELNVELKAVGVVVGITSITIQGDLVTLLTPPLKKPPFFGGIQVYFPNPPEIGIDFVGAAKVANLPGLRSTIRGAIDGAVAGVCVLPRRIAVDMDEEDAVDLVDLKYPEPIGVLRFTLYSGAELVASDTNMFGPPTSDPYVVAKLGIDTWTSPTIDKTLNPKWGSNGEGVTVDFPVYELCQKFLLKVFDSDFVQSDDLIGVAEALDVETLLSKCGGGRVSLPLMTADRQPGGGSLYVSTRLLKLSTSGRPRGLAARKGPSIAILFFKVLTVVGLDGLNPSAKSPFRMRLRIHGAGARHWAAGEAGDADRAQGQSKRSLFRSNSTTSNVDQCLEKLTDPSFPAPLPVLAEALQPICSALKSRGHSTGDIAEILEVAEAQVEQFLAYHPGHKATREELRVAKEAEATLLAKRSLRSPRFDQVLQLLIPAAADASSLELAVLDKQSKILGRVALDIEQVVAATDMRLDGPFVTDTGLEIVGSVWLRWLA